MRPICLTHAPCVIDPVPSHAPCEIDLFHLMTPVRLTLFRLMPPPPCSFSTVSWGDEQLLAAMLAAGETPTVTRQRPGTSRLAPPVVPKPSDGRCVNGVNGVGQGWAHPISPCCGIALVWANFRSR